MFASAATGIGQLQPLCRICPSIVLHGFDEIHAKHFTNHTDTSDRSQRVILVLGPLSIKVKTKEGIPVVAEAEDGRLRERGRGG